MSGVSRTKGRNGERELTAVFRAAGWHVSQGQRNLKGECDLRAERGTPPYTAEASVTDPGKVTYVDPKYVGLHVECKRAERLRLPEWIAQAKADAAPGTTPVVVYRQNRGEWRADLSLDDLLELIG